MAEKSLTLALAKANQWPLGLHAIAESDVVRKPGLHVKVVERDEPI
jgi:hypothetical protein